MKRLLLAVVAVCLCSFLSGCNKTSTVQIAATTAPVYEFTTQICAGTDLRIGRIITEEVSCLHDYTLQTDQMRMIENAQTVIISGAGLEDFLQDALPSSNHIIDASESVALLCGESDHDHEDDHHHEQDPHIWLSPANARIMAQNICAGLSVEYPQYTEVFQANLQSLLSDLVELESYGRTQLQSLSSRNLVTFHDGFAYLAQAFDLHILRAIEDESGSEASAGELIEICKTVTENNLPAIFTEQNGSTAAATIVSSETNTGIYRLDMAMSGNGYCNAMYHNIDTLKEALG